MIGNRVNNDDQDYLSTHKLNTVQLIHPKYRADIDGLRAIAVLSVVGFHAFPKWIRGGFIGVDIFFVISGFLISTIILENLERKSFSFTEFYIRRIKRIFPALLLVLFASFAFGWVVLFGEEFRQLGKHIVGGTAFISNLLLWKEQGYFNNAAETKPLLHLWSLGIEEQFYIFWPLLLWFSWKKGFNLLLITISVAAFSFALNIWKVNSNIEAAFYSPQTRLWELLMGAVLAHISLHRQSALQRFKLCNDSLQSFLGTALIIVGILLITEQSAFPGWWALLPTLGAVLIISAGTQAWLNRTVLSNRLLVWFGLISYPLYLWHWPILSFAHIVEGGIPMRGIRIAAVVVSVILAALTYEVIEKPIRRNADRRTVWVLILGMLVIFVIGTVIFLKGGLVNRKVNLPFNTAHSKAFLLSRVSDDSCLKKMNLALISEEVCLTNSKKPRILFVGDSSAMALYSSIYAGKSEFADQSILISGHACRPYANLESSPMGKNTFGNNCKNIAREELRIAKTLDSISTVVIANADPKIEIGRKSIYRKDGVLLDEETAFVEGNGYFINDLLKSGKRVIYMISTPILKHDPVDCETRVSFIKPKDCRIKESEFFNSRAIYTKDINVLENKYPHLKVFDSTSIFCKYGICNAKDNSGYLYQDSVHLSFYGSEKVLNLLLKDKLID